MGRLTGLKIDEFSIVRGGELQPANPEATVAFYKATKKEESMAEPNVQTPPAATPPISMGKQLTKAIRDVIAKAKTTRTSTYTSNSTSTDVWDEPDPAAMGAEPTVIVIQDAVEKTEPAAPAEDGGDLAAAVEPIVKAINKLESRIMLIEKGSAGSRAIAKGTAGVTVRDNSDVKFGDFTKFLAQRSGLSNGQRLTKTTLTSSGWTYGLSFAEAGNFIDYIVNESVLLKQCRTVKMPNVKYNIDKIGLGTKVLKKGTPGVDPGDTVEAGTPTQVQLTAEEVIAIVSIGDDTLEDNIEGEAFVQHLLGMIGRAAANELEEMAIHGDTAVADDYILDRLNGWYKLAKAAGAHVIDATADDDRYWPGDSGSKATRLIKKLPTKYRNDLRQLAFLQHSDVYLDFNDMIAEKGYNEAFAAITGMRDLPLRSIRNIQVPLMHTDMTVAGEDDGTMIMLTNLQNLIFGIHREIKMEPYRQPRKRATDYVLSMRCAAQVENGDAIAIYDNAAVRPA